MAENKETISVELTVEKFEELTNLGIEINFQFQQIDNLTSKLELAKLRHQVLKSMQTELLKANDLDPNLNYALDKTTLTATVVN